jgi:hypothetical protein
MTIDDLTRDYVASVRDDPDPTVRAIAMAAAVRQHVEDLMADDDPGEGGLTMRELQCVWRTADGLVKALQGFAIVLLCALPAQAQGRTVCLQGGCITSSAPPLPPREAIKVLCRDNRCTPPPVVIDGDGPRAFIIRHRPEPRLEYRFPYCSYYTPCRGGHREGRRYLRP